MELYGDTPFRIGWSLPVSGIFTSHFLLSLLIWVPVVVAVSIAFMPNPRGRYDTLIKQIAFFTNLGLMVLLFIAYNQFENFLPTVQYEEKIPWLPGIGASYHLGVDGPGILLMMLSGLIGIASVLASLGIRERVRSYFALLYQLLVGRDTGPRLPTLLLAIGAERVRELLSLPTA